MNPRAFRLLLLALLGFGVPPLSAQQAANIPVAPPASATSSSGSAAAVSARGDTLLHRNDLVRITVFQEDDLTTETRISKSGMIIFPLIGPLRVDGRSVDDVTGEIRSRLDKDYLVNPHVTLTILDFAKQWVTVLGEVQKPGQVEIPAEGGIDLLAAIAAAGGYSRVADPSHVTVRRQVDGRDTVQLVNAKQLARDVQMKSFPVYPGDVISVAQSLF